MSSKFMAKKRCYVQELPLRQVRALSHLRWSKIIQVTHVVFSSFTQVLFF